MPLTSQRLRLELFVRRDCLGSQASVYPPASAAQGTDSVNESPRNQPLEGIKYKFSDFLAHVRTGHFEKCSISKHVLFRILSVASDRIPTQTSLHTRRNLLPPVQGSPGRC